MKKVYWSLSLMLAWSSPVMAQSSNYPESNLAPAYAADTGAVNVLAIALTPCPSAYVTGKLFRVLPNHANTTTTPTLNVCGLGAKTITKFGQSAVAANDLLTTMVAELIYDGTDMELQNPQTVSSLAPLASPTFTGTVTTPLTTAGLVTTTSGGVLGSEANATIAQGGTNATSATAGTIPNATSGTATSWTSTPTLGASGTLGSLTMGNTTSGLLTLEPATGALGTVTVSIPAATDTLVNLAGTQTLTNKSIAGSEINSGTVANTYGGTGLNSSASTGVAQVSSGTWSVSTALPNGTTATTQAQLDGSTKVGTTNYTDTAVANAVAGVNPAEAVLAASTANLTGTYVQVGGGVGDTFTITATGTFSLDGISINATGQRVLFKNQTTASQNGVYTSTVVGTSGVSAVFTRASDYNTPSNVNNTGAIPVQSGTVNATTSWLLTSQVTSIGSSGSSLTYAQFSYAPSNVAGVGSCTNQVVTATVAGTAPTCTTITSAYVNSSIAPTASPALTGTPTVPTAAAGTNTTQAASTAFVTTAVAGALQTATVVITSAQFLAMNNLASTDVTIVAAQGSGKIIIPVFAAINMNYPASGGVAYTTGSGLLGWFQNSSSTHNLSYATSGSGSCPSLTNAQIETTNSAVVFGTFTFYPNGNGGFAISTIANNALTMNISQTAQYTAGNSTFTVTVWYQVVSVS